MSIQLPPMIISPHLLPLLAQLQIELKGNAGIKRVAVSRPPFHGRLTTGSINVAQKIKYGIPYVPVIPISFSPVPSHSSTEITVSSMSPPSRTLSPTTSQNSHTSASTSSPSTPSPTSTEKICRCDVCGKTFSRHWLLQGHLRTHTGERPFKCGSCGKAFADKSNLRAHVQTHSGVKPFECSRCGRRFALRSYLSKHEDSHNPCKPQNIWREFKM